jgi:hypothetical protein
MVTNLQNTMVANHQNTLSIIIKNMVNNRQKTGSTIVKTDGHKSSKNIVKHHQKTGIHARSHSSWSRGQTRPDFYTGLPPVRLWLKGVFTSRLKGGGCSPPRQVPTPGARRVPQNRSVVPPISRSFA